MTAHTDQQYEEDLGSLKESILKMGGLVEAMIQQAIIALIQRETVLVQKVKKMDIDVDRLEVDIGEQCITLLALHQPAASDLRFITIGLRISNDLERMGDLAVNIAQRAERLTQSHPLNPDKDFIECSKMVQGMVKKALDSFVNNNVDQATEVLEEDDQVDHATWEIYEVLQEKMKGDPQIIPSALNLLLVSRHLERLADHATNIAEEVIYQVKGKDIRHQTKLSA